MISYIKVVVKFEKILNILSNMMFRNEVSHRKNLRVEHDSIRSGVKVIVEL
jgi:hypothetical protein